MEIYHQQSDLCSITDIAFFEFFGTVIDVTDDNTDTTDNARTTIHHTTSDKQHHNDSIPHHATHTSTRHTTCHTLCAASTKENENG